ncbi:MAG TPA: flavodoxin domain-containing protein [Solirubrobacterales bacterium]|nr:flavodoxin domain-containing protein [Solirubrobacterales bacterium]
MKMLVAYASKRGSTAEIAEAISGVLRRDGISVDCEAVGDVKSVDPYDAVILGSAVYIKRWRGDAKHFLRQHRRALAQRPFWVFSSGPAGDPAEDRPEWAEPASIVEKVERLGGRGHVVFGGRLPVEPHGPIEKAMVQNTPAEYRDRRDWDEIRAWATSIAAELKTGAAAA